MLLFLLKQYWKQLLGALLITYVLHTSYMFAYNRGYQSKTDEVVKLQIKQSEELAKLSKTVLDVSDKLTKDNIDLKNDILVSIKSKPLFKIDSRGKCVLTSDFEAAYKGVLK